MQSTPGPAIHLRIDRLRAIASAEGLRSDRQLAFHLGVSTGALCRLLRGDHSPSTRFIALALTAWPNLAFPDLFEISAGNAVGDAA